MGCEFVPRENLAGDLLEPPVSFTSRAAPRTASDLPREAAIALSLREKSVVLLEVSDNQVYFSTGCIGTCRLLRVPITLVAIVSRQLFLASSASHGIRQILVIPEFTRIVAFSGSKACEGEEGEDVGELHFEELGDW